jgi:hypothetical protein
MRLSKKYSRKRRVSRKTLRGGRKSIRRKSIRRKSLRGGGNNARDLLPARRLRKKKPNPEVDGQFSDNENDNDNGNQPDYYGESVQPTSETGGHNQGNNVSWRNNIIPLSFYNRVIKGEHAVGKFVQKKINWLFGTNKSTEPPEDPIKCRTCGRDIVYTRRVQRHGDYYHDTCLRLQENNNSELDANIEVANLILDHTNKYKTKFTTAINSYSNIKRDGIDNVINTMITELTNYLKPESTIDNNTLKEMVTKLYTSAISYFYVVQLHSITMEPQVLGWFGGIQLDLRIDHKEYKQRLNETTDSVFEFLRLQIKKSYEPRFYPFVFYQ